MPARKQPGRAQRVPHLRWVPIAEMRVSPRAQRGLRQAHVDALAANFDLEAIGYPVVNLRDGYYYVVDGQHRVAALKAIGWGDQQIQCECYEGLTDADEAELFLRRDARRAINTFDKFRIGLTAEREIECDIDRIVRANNLVVSREKIDGAVSAVGTLRRVYQRAGGVTLGRTLRIIRDAYGDPGFTSFVIDGIALVCQRYNGELDDEKAVTKLSAAHGGVNGLLGRAANLQKQTGNTKNHCVAAAAVDIINSGRGGVKLPAWWRSDPEKSSA